MTTFSGVFAPVPTPFADDGELDLAAWGENVDRWMGTSLRGLVVLGTNGEAPLVEESILQMSDIKFPNHSTFKRLYKVFYTY